MEAVPLRGATAHVTIQGIEPGEVIEPDEARELARLLVEAADRVEEELLPKTRTVPRVEYFETMGWCGYRERVGIWLTGGVVYGQWRVDGTVVPPNQRNAFHGWRAGPDEPSGWPDKATLRQPEYLRALAALYENPTEEVVDPGNEVPL